MTVFKNHKVNPIGSILIFFNINRHDKCHYLFLLNNRRPGWAGDKNRAFADNMQSVFHHIGPLSGNYESLRLSLSKASWPSGNKHDWLWITKSNTILSYISYNMSCIKEKKFFQNAWTLYLNIYALSATIWTNAFYAPAK